MNTAYTPADCSQDYPRREWPGVKTRRSGLCQCSVLGKIDQRKLCSLQLGIKAGLRVDSAPQPIEAAGPLTHCTRFRVLFSFSSLAPGPLRQHMQDTNQKKDEVAVLISDKADFKAKEITKVRQGHYTMFKRINQPIKHSNPKCKHTKQHSCQICKTKTD